MDEDLFEGTLVLEKLAEAGLLDAFYEAVDSDDFKQASRLMRKARIDVETVQAVLARMGEGYP